ncbi:MAG: PIN domain-containing protein [Terriglobales bacterium]
MSRVYFDAMIFIYLWEDHRHFGPQVDELLDRMEARGDILCTSALSVGEVLAGALRQGNEKLVARVRSGFRDPAIEVLDFHQGTAEVFAALRASMKVTAADAIHLATAAEAGTDIFITNDASLIGKMVPGIGVVVGLETDLA